MTHLSENYRTWLPHGFDVATPEETDQIRIISEKVRQIFQKHSFHEILLPTFDFARTFEITSRSGNQNGFDTRDRDGLNLAVRSDLTVQVVKAVAVGRLGSGEQKVSYLQPVFHDRPWGTGLRREIYQAGIEWIGYNGEDRFDALLRLAREVLGALGYEARILYGDARFLNRLFSTVPDNFRSHLAEAFHTKDTFRIKEVAREAGLEASTARIMENVPLIFGNGEALEELKLLCKNRNDLLELLDFAGTLKDVIYDFSLVQELSYYSGPVFEGYIPGTKHRVLSGGIYDDLYREFAPAGTDPSITAGGFALDISELVNIVQARG